MIETVIFQTSTTVTEACNNLFRFLIELHDWSQKAQEIRTELAVIMECFLYEMLQGYNHFPENRVRTFYSSTEAFLWNTVETPSYILNKQYLLPLRYQVFNT